MKSNMQALIQTLEGSLVERKKSLQATKRSNGISQGTNWGSFSSRHGPNSNDGIDDNYVILDYSKQVRVFLP